MRFSFFTKINKAYEIAMTGSSHQFKPSTTPQADWPNFVEQVENHLQSYKSEGILPEQYGMMLETHFN
jgi:hypothetical protein